MGWMPVLSFAQGEYFTTDSLTSYGLKLIDNGDLMNSNICEVKIKDRIVKYSPYEVKEYGFKDGRVYKSREIQLGDSSKKVFMECLTSEKTTLFYYRGKGIKIFYLEKDSTLFVELPKKYAGKEIYAEQLSQITSDCFNVSDACKLVSYTKKSLSKLITRYNQCVLKPFPHFKYGFLVGYEFLKLNPSTEQNDHLEYFNYTHDGSLSLGIFLDSPIQASDLSLHAELSFSDHGYSYNHASTTEDLNLLVNISSLRVPVLLRYTLPNNNLRPYFNVGTQFSFNNKKESGLYKTTFSENMIEINNLLDETIISTYDMGYLTGCGVECDLDYKRSVFLEIRYGNQFSISDNIRNSNSMVLISSGINF